MNTRAELPLVSIALISYNQEPFIAESIAAVLAQDYGNLEIVLSDDCSKDRTFEIMEAMARAYTGPHAIKLNRNPRNRGIGHHVNVCHALTRGALIVHADGDDVSLPHRVRTIYEAWRDERTRPSLICSNALKVDARGIPLGTLMSATEGGFHLRDENPMRPRARMLGCTVAVDRTVIERFGPMMERVMAADTVWYRRAYLLNGVRYVPEVLVKYRQGTGGVSQVAERSRDAYLKNELKWIADRIVRFEQMRTDVACINPASRAAILDEVRAQEEAERRKLAMLSGSLPTSVASLVGEYLSGSRMWADYRETVRAFMIRWLPTLIRYR